LPINADMPGIDRPANRGATVHGHLLGEKYVQPSAGQFGRD
jgi:hypothetical protein